MTPEAKKLLEVYESLDSLSEKAIFLIKLERALEEVSKGSSYDS